VNVNHDFHDDRSFPNCRYWLGASNPKFPWLNPRSKSKRLSRLISLDFASLVAEWANHVANPASQHLAGFLLGFFDPSYRPRELSATYIGASASYGSATCHEYTSRIPSISVTKPKRGRSPYASVPTSVDGRTAPAHQCPDIVFGALALDSRWIRRRGFAIRSCCDVEKVGADERESVFHYVSYVHSWASGKPCIPRRQSTPRWLAARTRLWCTVIRP